MVGSVLVTGAAHGVGLGVASLFHEEGLSVAALDVDSETLVKSCGGFADVLVDCDVRVPVDEIVVGCGELWVPDVLVCNVGVVDGRSILDLSGSEFEVAFDVNVFAAYRLVRRWAMDLIDKGRSGSCVFVSSLHSSRVRGCVDYSASKAAISMMVKEFAVALACHGIRVNSVSPGAIDTWSAGMNDGGEHLSASEAVVPLGRLGSPADVASAVLWLSDASRSGYVTGSDIRVDGGLSMYTWLNHLYGDK